MDLPKWLKTRGDKSGKVDVDPDLFYPAILKELENTDGIPYKGKNLDQYWLEVAYCIMRLDTQYYLFLTGKDPRPAKTLEIMVQGKPGHKDRWAVKNFPPGRMAEINWREAAREARIHWSRLKRAKS